MNVGFKHLRNSQLYGFNNSSTGKICVAKCEEENGQIIIIQSIAMKTCIVFNIIVKKIKLKTSKPHKFCQNVQLRPLKSQTGKI
jgi:hypothetical protein